MLKANHCPSRRSLRTVCIETISLIFWIGLYSYRDDEFTQLVSLDDERSLLADFRDYLKQQEMPTVVYYAGNSFDENRLLESAERTNVKIADIIDEWVDLCLLARRTTFLPRKCHELDAVASGLGYIFAHPDG
ncbi:ribonuclease H-like domain-containing protein [Halorientalis litorea]|uniref:ribonuclease H-like domain-containing protein n=1 Tax=Halorientalis litorea TaxID=2931977 RepID=UPI003564621F